MNPSSSYNATKPVWRLCKGAEQHSREVGTFEVRCNDNAVSFSNLLAAFLYYLKLNQPASLWDTTEEIILVEEKVWLNTANADRLKRN